MLGGRGGLRKWRPSHALEASDAALTRPWRDMWGAGAVLVSGPNPSRSRAGARFFQCLRREPRSPGGESMLGGRRGLPKWQTSYVLEGPDAALTRPWRGPGAPLWGAGAVLVSGPNPSRTRAGALFFRYLRRDPRSPRGERMLGGRRGLQQWHTSPALDASGAALTRP